MGARPRRAVRVVAALALIVCGGTGAGADGTVIPGTYDPATQTFRLYPVPQAPAAASPKIYTGTLNITATLYLSVPAGTTVSGTAEAYAGDYAGGLDDIANTQITSSGTTATMQFSIPYAARLGDPSDTIMVTVSVNATYQNKQSVSFNQRSLGTANIALPKDGATTKVTVYVGA